MMTRTRAGNFSKMAVAILLVGACKEASPPAEQSVRAPAPTSEPAAAAPKAATVDPALVKRGEYLVEAVMACGVCHTPMGPEGPDETKRFAGGFEFAEVFGTWRSLNITPDRQTGIGAWTDEQVLAALREGRRPDGTRLHPIMPWVRYRQLSDGDAKAVVAYLRTLTPVSNSVTRADLKIPEINLPPAQGKEPGDDPLERGKYLTNLALCGDCHTPLKDDFMPDTTKEYAGGMLWRMPPEIGTGIVYGQNLTPDAKTGLGRFTDQQIADVFTKGRKLDGSPLLPPMTFMVPVYAQLTAEDALLIVKYLKSLRPIRNKVPKSTFAPAVPRAQAQ